MGSNPRGLWLGELDGLFIKLLLFGRLALLTGHTELSASPQVTPAEKSKTVSLSLSWTISRQTTYARLFAMERRRRQAVTCRVVFIVQVGSLTDRLTTFGDVSGRNRDVYETLWLKFWVRSPVLKMKYKVVGVISLNYGAYKYQNCISVSLKSALLI